MRSPVALILFNRPEQTERVFSAIARARPPRLLLVADGPRPGDTRDVERCAAARAVVERVDWDCEVERDYAETNLGCGRRPASGLDRVFERVDRAIILEDDCVPDATFFPYCDELLERFADDRRICQISGQSFQRGHVRGPYSYYFSRHNICAGGWATWRRAWRHYDFEMRLWPELRETGLLREVLGDERAVRHWQALFDRAFAAGGVADYWDYQWTFACWAQGGLSVLPNASLLSNIGFGPDATHTRSADHPQANLPLEPIELPLRHPPYVAAHAEADQFFVDTVVAPAVQAGWATRLRWRLGALLPGPARRMVDRLRGRSV